MFTFSCDSFTEILADCHSDIRAIRTGKLFFFVPFFYIALSCVCFSIDFDIVEYQNWLVGPVGYGWDGNEN